MPSVNEAYASSTSPRSPSAWSARVRVQRLRERSELIFDLAAGRCGYVQSEDGVGRPFRCVGADDASYVRPRGALASCVDVALLWDQHWLCLEAMRSAAARAAGSGSSAICSRALV